MKPRIWAIAGAVWAAFYVGLYIGLVHGQEGGVRVIYAFVVIVAGLLLLPTGMLGPTLRRANLILGALVLFVLAALWGIHKGFGLLLLPSIFSAARALSKVSREAPPGARTLPE